MKAKVSVVKQLKLYPLRATNTDLHIRQFKQFLQRVEIAILWRFVIKVTKSTGVEVSLSDDCGFFFIFNNLQCF